MTAVPEIYDYTVDFWMTVPATYDYKVVLWVWEPEL